jgi:hypothetical protein
VVASALSADRLRFLAEDLARVSETDLALVATEQYLKLDPGDPAMTNQLGWLKLRAKTTVQQPPPTPAGRPGGLVGRLLGRARAS